MSVSYDIFVDAFLGKISEYSFLEIPSVTRTEIVDGYMKRAFVSFKKNCKYDFYTTGNDTSRAFDLDISDSDLYEIVDIVSDGMIVQWLKPYVYKQELLENALSTRDYSVYSPAELLKRVSDAYAKAQSDYKQAIMDYSYNKGELGDLHL